MHALRDEYAMSHAYAVANNGLYPAATYKVNGLLV